MWEFRSFFTTLLVLYGCCHRGCRVLWRTCITRAYRLLFLGFVGMRHRSLTLQWPPSIIWVSPSPVVPPQWFLAVDSDRSQSPPALTHAKSKQCREYHRSNGYFTHVFSPFQILNLVLEIGKLKEQEAVTVYAQASLVLSDRHGTIDRS